MYKKKRKQQQHWPCARTVERYEGQVRINDEGKGEAEIGICRHQL